MTSAFNGNFSLGSYTNVNASAVAKAIKITGNASANSIVGSGYNDSIYGAAGNDTLVGNAGTQAATS